MHLFFLIALIVTGAGLAGGWIVGRFQSTAGAYISLISGFVGRLAVGVAMAYASERALQRGGWFIALVVLFGVIGLFSLLTAVAYAGALWLLATGRTLD